MRADPTVSRSWFSSLIGYAIFAPLGAVADIATFGVILLGALAIAVFGVVRQLLRPSISVWKAREYSREEGGEGK